MKKNLIGLHLSLIFFINEEMFLFKIRTNLLRNILENVCSFKNGKKVYLFFNIYND